MKIINISFLLIIILIFSITIYSKKINLKNNNDESTKRKTETVSKFANAGFNSDEEELITSKLNDNQIALVLSNKYEKNFLISLLKEKYFISDNLDRYISFYNQYNSEVSEVIKDVNSNIDVDFYTEQVPSDLTKGILIIVNKHYALPSNFEGIDIVEVSSKYAYYDVTYYLNKEAYNNFERMWKDAKKKGLEFAIYSAYRSYNTQNTLYTGYVSKDGKDLADTYSARPGNSEHQTGLAIDLKSKTMNTDYFEKTEEYKWLKDNAYKYGFIERYELGAEYITGYQYEPWHLRYCGIKCATYIHENKITYEEYYEYYVKNKY